ncbi:MAG: hypothetical protein CMF62_12190 [Magnetococcales bacterium]|jgi:flagellar export protein FliJ|nr:hypothetical protein [Magnetococcales bacterium]|tara:strand:- start:197795 stop:198223 length:429 start_codon:yes stop_codon:yes gene_type:complete
MADTIKTLDNLVRLAKKNVEDIQKQIAEVQTAIEGHVLKIRSLQKKIEDEGEAAGTDPMLLTALSRFTEKTEKDIKERQGKVQALRQHEAQLRDQLTEEFATQKRYEILYERKLLEEKQRIQKAQQDQLDEVAATSQRNKIS